MHRNGVLGVWDTGYVVPPGRRFVVTDLTATNDDGSVFEYPAQVAFVDPGNLSILGDIAYVTFQQTEHLRYANGPVFAAGQAVAVACITPARDNVRVGGYETDLP